MLVLDAKMILLTLEFSTNVVQGGLTFAYLFGSHGVTCCASC